METYRKIVCHENLRIGYCYPNLSFGGTIIYHSGPNVDIRNLVKMKNTCWTDYHFYQQEWILPSDSLQICPSQFWSAESWRNSMGKTVRSRATKCPELGQWYSQPEDLEVFHHRFQGKPTLCTWSLHRRESQAPHDSSGTFRKLHEKQSQRTIMCGLETLIGYGYIALNQREQIDLACQAPQRMIWKESRIMIQKTGQTL